MGALRFVEKFSLFDKFADGGTFPGKAGNDCWYADGEYDTIKPPITLTLFYAIPNCQ